MTDLDLSRIEAMVPHVTACVNLLNQGKLLQAREHYSHFEDSPLPRHKAIGARLLLLLGETKKANELFEEALQIASRRSTATNQYIVQYCEAFLAARTDEEKFQEHAAKAAELLPSNELFLCLPIFHPNDDQDIHG